MFKAVLGSWGERHNSVNIVNIEIWAVIWTL